MSSSDPNATAAVSSNTTSSGAGNPHVTSTSLSLHDQPHHRQHYQHHHQLQPHPLPPAPSPAAGGVTSTSNSPSPSPHTREYRKGNWTLHETLVLITAKRLDDERRTSRGSGGGGGGISLGSPVCSAGRSAELRWKWVENYCWRNGCLRSQNQCNDKWDNLLRDYKKVRDYEARCGAAVASNAGGGSTPTPASVVLSYWSMEKHDRKERNLPSNLAAEVYHALTDVLSRRNANRVVSPSAVTSPPAVVSPLPSPSLAAANTATPVLLPSPHLANHHRDVPTTPTGPATAPTPSPAFPGASIPPPASAAVCTPPPTLPAPPAPPAHHQKERQQQVESSSVPAAESTPPDDTSSSSSPPPSSPEGANNICSSKHHHHHLIGADRNAGAVVLLGGSDAKPPSEPPDLDRPRGRRRKRSRSPSQPREDDYVDDNSGLERGASVLARALLASEERREKRHREMLEVEERRARAEEARGEASRHGVEGLIAAVNNLAGAIHALVSDHHSHSHRPPPAR